MYMCLFSYLTAEIKKQKVWDDFFHSNLTTELF